jgi:hypothetical protein
VLTANARVRLKDSSGVVAYVESTEETQTLSTRGDLSFENRFQNARIVRVAEGEASSLNFHQLRVVASEPTAVASSQLKKRLEEFRLDEQDVSDAVAVARKRQDRKIASVLGTPPVPVVAAPGKDSGTNVHEGAHTLVVTENPEQNGNHTQNADKDFAQAPGSSRAPAAHDGGGVGHTPIKSDYSRHPGVSPEQQEEIRAQLAEKTAGHGPVSEDMISPDEGGAELVRAPVASKTGGALQVRDPDERGRAPASGRKKKVSSEDAEKKRLLDELSRIHAH